HEFGGGFVGAAMGVGALSIGIVFHEQIMQLFGVFAGDFLIATLPNQDRRIVTEVNQRVAECRSAELPGCTGSIGFAIDAGLIEDDAQSIASFDAGAACGTMAPADKIAAGVLH